jgi:CMP-2-keto-3-deoxyoctulosonic acid synthetase
MLRPRQCRELLVDLQARVLLPSRVRHYGRTACRHRWLHRLLQSRPSLLEGRQRQSRQLRVIVGSSNTHRSIRTVSTFAGEPHNEYVDRWTVV